MTDYRTPITQTDIVFAFADEREQLTRRQIAERLNRKPHGALNNKIDSLVDEGYLERTVTTLPNGVGMYLYRRTFPLQEA